MLVAQPTASSQPGRMMTRFKAPSTTAGQLRLNFAELGFSYLRLNLRNSVPTVPLPTRSAKALRACSMGLDNNLRHWQPGSRGVDVKPALSRSSRNPADYIKLGPRQPLFGVVRNGKAQLSTERAPRNATLFPRSEL